MRILALVSEAFGGFGDIAKFNRDFIGVAEVLKRPKGIIPPGLNYFSLENFHRRCHDIIRQILEKRMIEPGP
jgi:hypothetical protein